MHGKSRASECFSMQRAPAVKTWVIGWTLTQANEAAQRRLSAHPSSKEVGRLGMLTPTDRR
jgi:hypothetical protein